jgi:hypothetical protein
VTASATIKGLRLLVERDGTFHRLALLSWSNTDASIYIFPTVPAGGSGFAGQLRIPAPGDKNTINYSRQCVGTPVEVGLHESGRCHAKAGSQQCEPAWGRKLFDDDDVAHVATISCFSLDGMETVQAPRSLPPKPDLVLTGSDPAWTAIHVPLFVCPDEAAAQKFKYWLTLARVDRPRPLYVAIGGRSTVEPPDNRDAGVLVMAGWGPGAASDSRPLNGVYGATSPLPPQQAEPPTADLSS